MLTSLTDESEMPWGKYQGMTMEEVPDDYLKYMYNAGKVCGRVKEYIEEYMHFYGD